jgi:GT2 family glycosyltransferase
MKVSVLIGSRNRPDVLSQCLESVLNQNYPDFEVLVLDDASDNIDLCQALMKRLSDPRLRCLRSNIQLGVAGGRNLLMREAGGSILCVIDDDAYFESCDAIRAFVDIFCSDSKIGIVACKVVNHQGNNTDLLVPFSRYWRYRKPDITDIAQDVSYYLGTCHAIRREVINHCGTYAEDMMFGCEELDLSYRVVSAGYRIYYEPSIIVHHYPQSSVVTTGKQGEAKEIYYTVQNRLYLAYKYLPLPYIPTYLACWLGYCFLKALRTGCLGFFFKGLIKGIRRLRTCHRTSLNTEARCYLREHYGRLWY